MAVFRSIGDGRYGSGGGQLGIRSVGLRLEVRDYVTGFRSLDGQGVRAPATMWS